MSDDDIDVFDVNRQIEKLSIDIEVDEVISHCKWHNYLIVKLKFGSKVICERKVELPDCIQQGRDRDQLIRESIRGRDE